MCDRGKSVDQSAVDRRFEVSEVYDPADLDKNTSRICRNDVFDSGDVSGQKFGGPMGHDAVPSKLSARRDLDYLLLETIQSEETAGTPVRSGGLGARGQHCPSDKTKPRYRHGRRKISAWKEDPPFSRRGTATNHPRRHAAAKCRTTGDYTVVLCGKCSTSLLGRITRHAFVTTVVIGPHKQEQGPRLVARVTFPAFSGHLSTVTVLI